MIDVDIRDDLIPGARVARIRVAGSVWGVEGLAQLLRCFRRLEEESCRTLLFDLARFDTGQDTTDLLTDFGYRFFLRALRGRLNPALAIGVIVPHQTLGGLLPVLEILGSWPLFESVPEALDWFRKTRGSRGSGNPYRTRTVRADHGRDEE